MIESPVTGSYLFANELLPQELTGLKHVGDVVEWAEPFVFVLGLLLSRENGSWRSILGMGGGDEWKEGHGSRKLFTLHFESCVASHIRCRCRRTNTLTQKKKSHYRHFTNTDAQIRTQSACLFPLSPRLRPCDRKDLDSCERRRCTQAPVARAHTKTNAVNTNTSRTPGGGGKKKNVSTQLPRTQAQTAKAKSFCVRQMHKAARTARTAAHKNFPSICSPTL